MLMLGCLLLILSSFNGSLCLFSANLSSEVKALNGSCLLIPCVFGPTLLISQPIVVWRINESSGVEVFRGSQPLANWSNLNVSVIGNLTQGNCTVLMTNITFQHQGLFYFSIEDNGNHQRYNATNPVRISVTDRPTLTQGDTIRENSTGILTCKAPLMCGYQPPTLTWSNTLNGTLQQYVENGTKSVISNLSFTALYLHNGMNVTCTLQYLAGADNRSAGQSLTLSVYYHPRGTTASINPSGKILLTMSVTLTCTSRANPASNYTWYKVNGTTVSTLGSEQNLTLPAVTLQDRGVYFCKGDNGWGKENSPAVNLEVDCLPITDTPAPYIIIGIEALLIAALTSVLVYTLTRQYKKKQLKKQEERTPQPVYSNHKVCSEQRRVAATNPQIFQDENNYEDLNGAKLSSIYETLP
ncbi:sialoadhesin-like [Polypterus senegalus]|uniref:sialoadhesin-like n=1 Tax=Polypterus senegalus TaxID=55291 RepID=UPI001966363F|nr:sialoadhesin-like [Polypterus senegalus]